MQWLPRLARSLLRSFSVWSIGCYRVFYPKAAKNIYKFINSQPQNFSVAVEGASMQIIKLKFRQTSERGFLVTLSCNNQPWEVEGYLTLMPPALKIALAQWQENYRQIDRVRSLVVLDANFRMVPKSVRVNSSAECINAVKTELNNWLNSSDPQWQTIRDALIAFSNQFSDQELQITLNSQDIALCRLPWQEWDLLQQYYPQAEVAISTPTAKDMAIASPSAAVNSKKPRILLVVGKSEGINTQSDLEVISQLLGKQAEIICLLQPSLKDLASALWCDRGYHIFIFTGHSGSNEDGTIGWIEVNDAERLTIPEFKDSFKQAIANGLQLAIFNSCDGLGLADRLSELNLAQTIVMSEPVPDEVAIEFLEHLFRGLSEHRSLFAAVHNARKKLEHFNSRYPGAVWLPTLCVKPLESYFTWQAATKNSFSQVSDRSGSVVNQSAMASQGLLARTARLFMLTIVCGLVFLAGLNSNSFISHLDWDIIPQSIKVIANYASPAPKLQLPLGTWQYGGSTTWRSINMVVNHELKQKYPNFQLIRSEHPTLPSGSGTGIRMLINGQISFALSSRPVNDTEYDAAIIRGKILKQVPVAIDGIAVVVNPQLNLDRLTIEQLSAIYRGKITNWSEIGGQNLPITAYARPPQSGTTEFWRQNILKERQYGTNVEFIEESQQAIAQVANSDRPGSIYFVSVSEVLNNCNLKLMAIARRAGSLAVDLNQNNNYCDSSQDPKQLLDVEVLRTGAYPLTRRLFIIIEINSPVDEEVGEAYKNFILTKKGQKLIGKAGFIPIRSF
ncbi:MAG: substrate-binding domain-containing protein [Cyanobacteria bacterium J06607_15]